MEAIARQRTVTAHYNGGQLKLAPHIMFERHGDLFVSALNMSKNWRDESEHKLGHFKLMGLADVELTEENFDPMPTYEATLPRSEDTLILAV